MHTCHVTKASDLASEGTFRIAEHAKTCQFTSHLSQPGLTHLTVHRKQASQEQGHPAGSVVTTRKEVSRLETRLTRLMYYC